MYGKVNEKNSFYDGRYCKVLETIVHPVAGTLYKVAVGNVTFILKDVELMGPWDLTNCTSNKLLALYDRALPNVSTITTDVEMFMNAIDAEFDRRNS